MRLFAVCLLLFIAGCASPNPNAGKIILNPDGTTNHIEQPYVPNSTVTGIANIGAAAAPAIPPPYNGILLAGLGLATAIAGAFAAVKNGQANTAKDQATQAVAATNQLAASVVAQGPTVAQAVLDHAATNEAVFPAVADAVNRKTVV